MLLLPFIFYITFSRIQTLSFSQNLMRITQALARVHTSTQLHSSLCSANFKSEMQVQVGRDGKQLCWKFWRQTKQASTPKYKFTKIHYDICVNALKPFDIIRCNSLVCSKRIQNELFMFVYSIRGQIQYLLKLRHHIAYCCLLSLARLLVQCMYKLGEREWAQSE